MNKKQMNLNLCFTILSFLVSIGLNFYITPLISGELGDAAYGFVGMANDFVSYAAIISSVLNSVAARFVAMEMHRGNLERANRYYSSVFIANVVLSVFILLIGGIFVSKSDVIFNIPLRLQTDVKITFFLTFFNYCIVLITSIFTVCTYVTNRLDIAGMRNAISYIIKFLIIIALFSTVHIRMYYIALATIVSSVFLAVMNMRLTKKLIPVLKVKTKDFNLKYIKILALSGIWMAFSNLSQVLMTGLDSVIANKMLGAGEMGILSVSRTIPNALILAISTVGVIFTPNFVELYAKGKNKELLTACKQSITVMGAILGVPTVGIIVFGSAFYSLWLPHKSAGEIGVIQILSVLMMMQSIFNMLTISIAQLSVVTNKLKLPVFMSFLLGMLNIIIVIILIKFTNLGLYAIAGVSSVLFIIRYLLFNPIYAAKIIGAKWYVFYGSILKSLIPLICLSVIYIYINHIIEIDTWKIFIGVVVSAGIVGYFFVFLCIYPQWLRRIMNKMKGRNDDKLYKEK